MNQAGQKKDLIALVADADIAATAKGLLGRSESLGIAEIDFDVFRHNNRDSGCRVQAANYLRQYHRDYHYSLVLFDRKGCSSNLPRVEIQNHVELDLRRNGWEDRSKAIVIDPELEAWVWGFKESLATLGWNESYCSLMRWLNEKGLWSASASKPSDPKKALKLVMKHTKRRHSSKIYQQLAREANFERCQDAAFDEFKNALQNWFPVGTP